MSLHDSDSEDTAIYHVVVNPEEQYSIWPAHREIPLGWTDVGKSGPKAECLAYIKEVWTDMRPLSLRRKMAEMAEKADANDASTPMPTEVAEQKDDLVTRLSTTLQPVEFISRPNRTAKALLERIQLGYVNIKFTNTKGGTELGVTLDNDALKKEDVNFDTGKGVVHLEGRLTLNGKKVRCVADIDVETFKGRGHLQAVEA